MKILIVDDDEFSRVILFEMLKDVGQCDMACDGFEAIDFFMRSRTEGAPYDLVCLDYIMPEMDGHQVLKQIRSIELKDCSHTSDAVKVIMISSMSDLEHIMMAFDAKVEAFLLKPFHREQLLENLISLGFRVS